MASSLLFRMNNRFLAAKAELASPTGGDSLLQSFNRINGISTPDRTKSNKYWSIE
jgi:hypothetical protein